MTEKSSSVSLRKILHGFRPSKQTQSKGTSDGRPQDHPPTSKTGAVAFEPTNTSSLPPAIDLRSPVEVTTSPGLPVSSIQTLAPAPPLLSTTLADTSQSPTRQTHISHTSPTTSPVPSIQWSVPPSRGYNLSPEGRYLGNTPERDQKGPRPIEASTLTSDLIANLHYVHAAAFHPSRDHHGARCLENTGVDVQHRVAEWAQDPNGKTIFWLKGVAGLGKSTISRTIAQQFEDRGQLGACFFFKKGERGSGNAKRLFTTIAAQLAMNIPSLKPFIAGAIATDPAISEKVMEHQFEKLVFQPQSELKQSPLGISAIFIVIDALDECEQERDQRTLLRLLMRVKDLKPVRLRIFLTSRPELPIRIGFAEASGDMHQELIFHEIPGRTIEKDLSIYLRHELTRIKAEHSKKGHQYLLSRDWPGDQNIQDLVALTAPSFISAATVCRSIEDPRWELEKRLGAILDHQIEMELAKHDRTYLTIISQLFVGEDELRKERLVKIFQEVIGAIAILADTLSIVSLANLLSIPKDWIHEIMGWLQYVLETPATEDIPMRPLHSSFLDFLVNPKMCEQDPFVVNEAEMHGKLASNCLQLMSRPECLRENICSLPTSGTSRIEIDRRSVDRHLPVEVQYACHYWVYHIERSRRLTCNDKQIHNFLLKHLLHWLEALSLMGEVSESIAMISKLQTVLNSTENMELLNLTRDIKRFVLYNLSTIKEWPLQVYASSLIFTPQKSIMRKLFRQKIPKWMCRTPEVQGHWTSISQTLEGHSQSVHSVSFSHDGKLLASGSIDKTIMLWDVSTGSALQVLEGHLDAVMSITFSPYGGQLASGSHDETVRLWDLRTGEVSRILQGHKDSVRSVAFSINGKQLASGGGKTIRIWDISNGSVIMRLQGHDSWIDSIAFSHDGKQLASGSRDSTIKLWDLATGSTLQTLKVHDTMFHSVAFSPDDRQLASASHDSALIWELATGLVLRTLEGHNDIVSCVVFSPDGTLLATGSDNDTVRLCDSATGAILQTLDSHSISVNSVAFSPDGTRLASGSWDHTISLWDLEMGATLRTEQMHNGSVSSVVFSSNNKLLASTSDDWTIKLWETGTGEALQTFKGHKGPVNSVAFSPNATQLASGSDDESVIVWDVLTGARLQLLLGHTEWVNSVLFFPNGTQLVSTSDDRSIRIWDVATGLPVRTLEGHTDWVRCLAFSPDGTQLASVSDDESIRLWDAATGHPLRTINGHRSWVRSVTFSPDGKQLASASRDKTVRTWDVSDGSALQTFETPTTVDWISFSDDGVRLETNRGDIYLQPSLTGLNPPSIYIKDDWVMRGEERLFWIPSDYRATCSAVRGDLLVLGHESGLVTFFGFRFSG